MDLPGDTRAATPSTDRGVAIGRSTRACDRDGGESTHDIAIASVITVPADHWPGWFWKAQ